MESGQGKGQLLSALAILVVFGGVLATVAGGRSSPTAQPTEDSLAELSVRIEPTVARRVAEIRSLAFDRVPEAEVVDSEYLNRLGAREIKRVDARRGAGEDEAELRIFGLLEADEELESIFGATGDLAAAAYDPRKDRLYVVSDAVSADPSLVEFILAHELTHALEDQRFGIGGGTRLDDDASLARTALTEGSATAIMVDYAARYIGAADLLGATAALGADDAGVPEFYLDQTTWTYIGGLRYVTALRRLGGGWKLVDHAFSERPPASTEQVLHPDKYVRDELPLVVAIDDESLQERDWRRADRGVVGELTTSQLLEVGVDTATAERAAAGWGGDRYELWRQEASPAGCEHPCREGYVLVIGWRMDSAGDAGQLAGALVEYLEDGLGGEGEGSGVWRVDGGFVALRAAGESVALVFAPDSGTAAAIAAGQTG